MRIALYVISWISAFMILGSIAFMVFNYQKIPGGMIFLGVAYILVWVVVYVLAMMNRREHNSTGYFGTLYVDLSDPDASLYSIVMDGDEVDPYFQNYDKVVMDVVRR